MKQVSNLTRDLGLRSNSTTLSDADLLDIHPTSNKMLYTNRHINSKNAPALPDIMSKQMFSDQRRSSGVIGAEGPIAIMSETP